MRSFIRIYGSAIINILLGVLNLVMYFINKRPLSLFAAGFIFALGISSFFHEKLYSQMRENRENLHRILDKYQAYIVQLQEILEGVANGNVKVTKKVPVKAEKEDRHLMN